MAATPDKPGIAPMTLPLAVAFAVASGVAVGNLYWSQPLFAQIAADFGVGVTQAGGLFTVTQAGYALGVLALVPLGDIVQRRTLVGAVLAASAFALVGCAFAPSMSVLAGALFCVGATTVAGQVLLPLTTDLSSAESRGRFVGIVSSGILLGILLSRTLSGVVSAALGWRAVYAMAAALDAALLPVMLRAIPKMPPRERVGYPRFIGSVFATAVRTPTLARVLLVNGLAFMAFNVFWTAATYLLSGEAYGFSTFQIGLASLAGVTGAAASVGVGGLVDRGLSAPATGAFALGVSASLALALPGQHSLACFLLAAAALSLASQGVSVLSQTRLFSLDAGARSRLNTVFVVSNFAFAAAGSALASALWNAGGWPAVCVGGIAAGLLSATAWAASRKAFRRFDEGKGMEAG